MHTDLGTTSLDLNYDGSQSPGSGGSLTQQTRNKRMRTSFKHHQLRTMKSYFAINQNPDAKDLKQLSQKTGLSKRVLQVDKRDLRKRKHLNKDIRNKVRRFQIEIFSSELLGLVPERSREMAAKRDASGW